MFPEFRGADRHTGAGRGGEVMERRGGGRMARGVS